MPPCQGGCREFEPRLPLHKKESDFQALFYFVFIFAKINKKYIKVTDFNIGKDFGSNHLPIFVKIMP